MQSSKNIMDFMSEMNRLFPNFENEQPQFNPSCQPRTQLFNTPIYQPANQSSSSADSLSPESYPDLALPPRCETPFLYRRQRPIVGRKIIPTEPKVIEPKRYDDFHYNQNWTLNPPEESLFSLTPPNYERFNQDYELFPTEKKVQFATPVKNQQKPIGSANISPSSSYSPSLPAYSPRTQNFSPRTNYSPTTQNYSPNPRSLDYSPGFNHQRFSPNANVNYGFSSANYQNLCQMTETQPRSLHQNSTQQFYLPRSGFSLEQNGKFCSFCRKNGETPAVYMGHALKERVDNRNIVRCPILRKLTCATCGATGDNAHTNTYCPVLRDLNNGTPLQSTTIILKSTRVKSNGRRRY